MASRVQKIKLWDTFKNAKSVILHFFPVAEIGRNIHLLYFSYPQQIYSQFVEWGKKVLSPHSPQWSVYFSVLLLLITRKHPVIQLRFILFYYFIKILISTNFNLAKVLDVGWGVYILHYEAMLSVCHASPWTEHLKCKTFKDVKQMYSVKW